MSKLIDADVLKDVFKKFVERDKQIQAWMSLIDKQPTVDAVEVVRCNDCKYYINESETCVKWVYHHTPNKSDYCSCGERKESVSK